MSSGLDFIGALTLPTLQPFAFRSLQFADGFYQLPRQWRHKSPQNGFLLIDSAIGAKVICTIFGFFGTFGVLFRNFDIGFAHCRVNSGQVCLFFAPRTL